MKGYKSKLIEVDGIAYNVLTKKLVDAGSNYSIGLHVTKVCNGIDELFCGTTIKENDNPIATAKTLIKYYLQNKETLSF